MCGMFRGCSSLKELNLDNFITNNVTCMNNMFRECSSLIELNLSNFETNNETKMYSMFYGCSNELKSRIRRKYNQFKEEAFEKNEKHENHD